MPEAATGQDLFISSKDYPKYTFLALGSFTICALPPPGTEKVWESNSNTSTPWHLCASSGRVCGRNFCKHLCRCFSIQFEVSLLFVIHIMTIEADVSESLLERNIKEESSTGRKPTITHKVNLVALVIQCGLILLYTVVFFLLVRFSRSEPGGTNRAYCKTRNPYCLGLANDT